MRKDRWSEDYNGFIQFDDYNKDPEIRGIVTRGFWDDADKVLVSFPGEATVLEAIKWIKKTGDRALYGYGSVFSFYRVDQNISRILYRFADTASYSEEDIKRFCLSRSEAAIMLGLIGVYNPQLAVLVSDLMEIRNPVQVIERAVKKHGKDVVVDVIDSLIEQHALAMTDLSEILLSKDPYYAACDHDGTAYVFKDGVPCRDE